jgi:hypothetical protein
MERMRECETTEPAAISAMPTQNKKPNKAKAADRRPKPKEKASMSI